MIYGQGCKGNYQQLRHFALPLPCFPKIGNHRSVLYVGNLNRLVRHLLDTGSGGIYCPQDREQVDTDRMVQTVARLHGRSLPLIPGVVSRVMRKIVYGSGRNLLQGAA